MLWSADRCRLAIEHREQHQVENRTAPGCAFLFFSASYIALYCATVTTGLWQSTIRSIFHGDQDDDRRSPLTSVPPVLTRAAAQHRTDGASVVALALGAYQPPRRRRHFDWEKRRNTIASPLRFRSPPVHGVECPGRRQSMGYSMNAGV